MKNPYWDNDFFQFFATLLSRLFSFEGSLAADELQILVLGCVAISCGLLGPLLVLRRMTMLANSLSHTILLGLVVSFLVTRTLAPLGSFDLVSLFLGAMAAALLTSFCTFFFSRVLRLQADASIGLVFTALFSLGIVLVTLYTRDVHLGVEAVMGSADTLSLQDLKLAGSMALVNATLIYLFFWQLQISSFDDSLASSLGIRSALFQALLLFLTAGSSISAFRAVGVLLVLSFLIGPPLIARLFTRRLSTLLLLSPLIGLFASLLGVALSRHVLTTSGLALSTGGIVSTLLALLYVLAHLYKQARERRVKLASLTNN